MENGQRKQKVALSSVIASLGLTVGKLTVGLLTGSLGILSEAAHSALDFIAALMTYFAVKTSDQGPNDKFPYGYAKVESISALLETGLLFLTSIWIIAEVIKRFIYPHHEIQTTWYAIVIIVVSIVIDAFRAYELNKVAKETKSHALEADALHFSSDIWSSGAVLIGLGFNYFGFPLADSIAALVVAVIVIRAGYSLGKRTINVLVDVAPSGLMQEIMSRIEFVPGLIKVKQLRVRQAGPTVFIDMIIMVNRNDSPSRTQELIEVIKNKIINIVPDADIIIHTERIELDRDTVLEKLRSTAMHFGFSIHHIFAHTANGKIYVNFDLEVDADMTLTASHKMAKDLEDILRNEISVDLVFNIHVEPMIKDPVIGVEPEREVKNKVENELKEVISAYQEFKNLHDIKVFNLNKGLIISAHAYSDGKIPLQKIHQLTEHIEYALKAKIENIERLVLHIEPTTT